MKAVKLPEHDFIYRYINTYNHSITRLMYRLFFLGFCGPLQQNMSNLALLLQSFGASVAFRPTHRK